MGGTRKDQTHRLLRCTEEGGFLRISEASPQRLLCLRAEVASCAVRTRDDSADAPTRRTTQETHRGESCARRSEQRLLECALFPFYLPPFF